LLSSKRNWKRRNKAEHRSVGFLAIFGSLAAILCTGFIAVCLIGASWLTDLPDYSNISAYANTGITTIYASDRHTVLAKLYLENRIEDTKDEVSDYVTNGIIATEDERFYEHGGVDPIGIARALFVNVTSGGTAEGASTITQQLVRNTVLLDEMTDRSIKRKVREMYIAVQVEQNYSKDDILMMYTNVVNFGDGCYGIEAASRDYFNKHASELTLSEAALLVGIPQSPTANNPREHMSTAMARRAVVLQRMLSNHYITQAEYDQVINETPVLADKNLADAEISNIAPYFVDYVKQLLADDEQFPASDIAHGGLSVYTTLDVTAQTAANAAVQNNLEYRESGLDASLSSVDPDTGEIVAMVGGKNYDTDQFNLATQMSRQAGSSFKAFTLLAALNEGVNPDSTYIDSSSPIQVGSTWTVSNSEGSGSGSMSVSDATTYSVNTVYARIAHAIGAAKVAKMAHACGIKSNLEEYDTITLGASGVNTLEMANAYATIANGGYYHNTSAVTEIVSVSGDTVYKHTPDSGTRVIPAAVAQKATEILKTVIQYGTGTGASLYSDQECAGKTGTSEHGRDLWFCGITPQYSTAVWAGYRTERETYLYGGSICAPIWQDYMTAVLKGKQTEKFPTTSEKITYKPSSTWDFDKDVTVLYEPEPETYETPSSTESTSASTAATASAAPTPEPTPTPSETASTTPAESATGTE
jgi:1A family penicillin-binding protein